MAATFAGTLMLGAPSAHAQQAPGASAAPDDNEMLYVGSIMGDDVYVRSGAAESYYPFFKVSRGDLVKVTGEKFGWTRVAIAGPAFADAFGYIKHARGDTSRFRISADGKSGTTLGRVDILAPNLDAGNQPKDSWKTLIRLEANQTVRVVESNDLGQEIVHKVSLPANVTGWISSQFVPHASAEDSELFKDILAGKIAPPEAAPGPTPEPVAKTPDSAVASHAGAAAQQASDQGVAPAGADSVLAGGAPTDVNTQAAPPEAPTTAPAVVAAASQPAKPKGPTFADLEARFEELRKEPVETAELMPLHDLYALYAKEHPNERAVQRRCDARMRQLSIWGELQIKKQEVAAAQERMKLSAEETAAVRDALERSAEYTAVGRIASSTIYDGSSLPKLFRIQDPATGRTVAYLKPDAEYTLANRVDMIVGIVGDKVYDETLRLNIITPRRIESLSPEKTAGAPTLTEPSEDK